jgi:hypothetical protein
VRQDRFVLVRPRDLAPIRADLTLITTTLMRMEAKLDRILGRMQEDDDGDEEGPDS